VFHPPRSARRIIHGLALLSPAGREPPPPDQTHLATNATLFFFVLFRLHRSSMLAQGHLCPLPPGPLFFWQAVNLFQRLLRQLPHPPFLIPRLLSGVRPWDPGFSDGERSCFFSFLAFDRVSPGPLIRARHAPPPRSFTNGTTPLSTVTVSGTSLPFLALRPFLCPQL